MGFPPEEGGLDIYKAIYGRRSVRHYDSSKDVSQVIIEKLLKAAVQAPSAGNIQPWRFWVIRDKNLKEAMAEAAGNQIFVAQASAVVVVCADLKASSWGYSKRGVDLYSIQDTAAAIQNLMLAAHAEGLGTCWVGAFSEEKAKRYLKLPEHIRPMAIIPLGYPSQQRKKSPKKDPLEFTEFR